MARALVLLSCLLCATAQADEVVGGQPPMPLVFVENQAQWPESVPFSSRFGPAHVRPERGGIVLALFGAEGERAHVLRLRLSEHAEPVGEDPVGSVFHFLLGPSAESWRANVPAYAKVTYEDAFPGTRLSLRGEGAAIVGEARVASGAFQLELEGADALAPRPDGSLQVRTSLGDVILAPPRIRSLGAARSAFPGRWAVRDGRVEAATSSGVDADLAYDVTWSTWFGGPSGGEKPRDVVVGEDGSITVCGWTNSDDYPTTPGVLDAEYSGPWSTGFVTRFAAGGASLVYSTYLGGSGTDAATCLALLADGEALIGGNSSSEDFPITEGALDETAVIGGDGFILRLAADGSAPVFSTFLGSDGIFEPGGKSWSGYDEIRCVALDSDGTIVVAGSTESPLFPVTPGAFQGALASPPNSEDTFVTRIDPLGTEILASTYLGGGPLEFNPGLDLMRGLAIREDGTIVVAGWTNSPSFPTTPGAFATEHANPDDWDGFITCLTPDLGSLVFSTYLGGVNDDRLEALALGPDGSVIVAGETYSFDLADFPTTPNAWSPTGVGLTDLFITRLSADGSTLEYSTLFGGAVFDGRPISLAVDGAGSVTVAGSTRSSTFPVTPGAFQEKIVAPGSTWNDLFVSRFDPDGRLLLYSTYLGGTGNELSSSDSAGTAIALTEDGDVVLAALSMTADFPTTPGTWQPDPSEPLVNNNVLVRLVPLPKGVMRYGEGQPGSVGLPAIGVLSQPSVGNDGFGTTCSAVPPEASGWLLVSWAGLDRAVMAGGVPLWVDPAGLLSIASVTSDVRGWSQTRVPVPPDPLIEGVDVFLQYVWPGPVDEPRAASKAVHATVQPVGDR